MERDSIKDVFKLDVGKFRAISKYGLEVFSKTKQSAKEKLQKLIDGQS